MQLWKLTGKDDRGARVVFRDPMCGRSRLSQADREVMGGPRHKANAFMAMTAIVVILLLQILQTVIRQSPMQALMQWSFVAVFASFGYFVVVPPIRAHVWNSKWKTRYKAIGRCPACQYDMKACEPQGDGCTVCPECSGAWRMEGANTASPAHQRESS